MCLYFLTMDTMWPAIPLPNCGYNVALLPDLGYNVSCLTLLPVPCLPLHPLVASSDDVLHLLSHLWFSSASSDSDSACEHIMTGAQHLFSVQSSEL